MVLQVLLTHVPPEELLQYQGARAHLEALIPYTGQPRRHGVPYFPMYRPLLLPTPTPTLNPAAGLNPVTQT